jgi:hypothetical protein
VTPKKMLLITPAIKSRERKPWPISGVMVSNAPYAVSPRKIKRANKLKVGRARNSQVRSRHCRSLFRVRRSWVAASRRKSCQKLRAGGAWVRGGGRMFIVRSLPGS